MYTNYESNLLWMPDSYIAKGVQSRHKKGRKFNQMNRIKTNHKIEKTEYKQRKNCIKLNWSFSMETKFKDYKGGPKLAYIKKIEIDQNKILRRLHTNREQI